MLEQQKKIGTSHIKSHKILQSGITSLLTYRRTGFNSAFVPEMLHFHKNNYEPGGKTTQTKSVTGITSANHTKYSENDLCVQYHTTKDAYS